MIRAEEHLSNTPRQIFIAHVARYRCRSMRICRTWPSRAARTNQQTEDRGLFKDPDFKKVYDHGQGIATALGLTTSAETFNPVIVDFNEQVGYLPDAILNYLVLLGWSLDDKTEFFSREEMIANFSLERVGSRRQAFDPKKLWGVRRQVHAGPADEAESAEADSISAAGRFLPTPVPWRSWPSCRRSSMLAGNRIKTFRRHPELHEASSPPTRRSNMTKAAFDKAIRAPGAVELLTKYRAQLATVEPYAVPRLEAFSQEFIAAEGKKIGELVHPLRVALTGQGSVSGCSTRWQFFGRESSMRRIDLAITRAK